MGNELTYKQLEVKTNRTSFVCGIRTEHYNRELSMSRHTIGQHKKIKFEQHGSHQDTRGEPEKGKQFLPLIRHMSCYSYSQDMLDTQQTQITQRKHEHSYKQENRYDAQTHIYWMTAHFPDFVQGQ